ncbi:MAG: family 43 glycosylhydrolase [Bacteroidales bacterium]|nr:family 43 glycosylhydrolase [Bacteroidales bacterium]
MSKLHLHISLPLLFAILLGLHLAGCNHAGEGSGEILNRVFTDPGTISGPFIPGYMADPSIIEHEGIYYLYGTFDPWGGYELAVWESSDFKHWTLRGLNWPNRLSCMTDPSNKAPVSAPSVVEGPDGRFYMYVSSAGEIWAGVSDHPLGPWDNLLPDGKPLLTYHDKETERNHDPECFIDDDGRVYLYWGGSEVCGYGKCYAVPLDSDMHTFLETPVEMKLPDYTGGPSVFRMDGSYFMLYSERHCDYVSSKIRYASSESPLGPWEQGSSSPLLKTDPEQGIYAPWSPAVFKKGARWFALFHANLPDSVYKPTRQIYVRELSMDSSGLLLLSPRQATLLKPAVRLQSASSRKSREYLASFLFDGDFGTLWMPSDTDKEPRIVVDLKEEREIRTIYMWFEYGHWIYRYRIEYSTDGEVWDEYADAYQRPGKGSPQFQSLYVDARYLRFTFFRGRVPVGLWEIEVE